MVTVGLDWHLKVWGLKFWKSPAYKLPFPPSHVTISQMGQVAVGCGVNVQVYSDPNINTITKPFLTYREAPSSVSSLQFVPMRIFDALGRNPYRERNEEAAQKEKSDNSWRNSSQRTHQKIKVADEVDRCFKSYSNQIQTNDNMFLIRIVQGVVNLKQRN
ncbi:unnamed protein product [Bursaphelenchus xylophilus]|uniref:(pine wood nematode) hypothetical protein n=1 Tax=Bursaphelenchus xylophilus TaxID=6326 RepID=A0A811LXU6_BURXY|nr:unnamed protein product [Bursaphelenchus xylophilus]CAG9126959.1 unnamed protein product [Bursaphelenchus xylophilus]